MKLSKIPRGLPETHLVFGSIAHNNEEAAMICLHAVLNECADSWIDLLAGHGVQLREFWCK